MRTEQPSATALRVAIRRAAHQILDVPKVFDDPLAGRILGAEAARLLESEVQESQTQLSRSLRAFVAARSRFAEDELARAVGQGASQYVVLGAGLDTFAYRNPFPARALRVFEVDHPATQAWKQRMLSEAGIPIPACLTFAPMDFEAQSLAVGLTSAGFEQNRATFFSWLGVTPYLTEAAFRETLGCIAAMPTGSGVAFDYGVPRSSLSWREKLAFDAISRRVAAAGEPFRLYLDPKLLDELVIGLGFAAITDLDSEEINSLYFGDRADGLRVGGGLAHLISARK
ncbi:MAG TPA: SAM-dependent methyltransferase [Candidatus Sulfotelmatobacter sp.]|nr:SAM-dependent methyltransferase [Candidatus Sulfotelmatobacter sp.]